MEVQISEFGQIPKQILKRPHPQELQVSKYSDCGRLSQPLTSCPSSFDGSGRRQQTEYSKIGLEIHLPSSQPRLRDVHQEHQRGWQVSKPRVDSGVRGEDLGDVAIG